VVAPLADAARCLMPWRGPAYTGEFPTLGWHVLERMTEALAAPDRAEYEPFILTDEQAQFVLHWYRVDPVTGRRIYRRSVLSRPKGWGKSPLGAAVCTAEALFDVVPDGFDANGEPVGRPWASVRTPWVQLAAVSEDQTKNAWLPLLEMLRDGPACDLYPGLEPMETFVNLPSGRIEYVTSAGPSKEGNRPVFVLLDQTEAWVPSNGGKKLAATLRRNAGKIGGATMEVPNAFEPGAESVAEDSAQFIKAISEGRVRTKGLLYDHREAPPDTDMADEESLLAGLAEAYGDSADVNGGWVDIGRLVQEIWDPDTDPSDARRYYLNQIIAASDAWFAPFEWAAVSRADLIVLPTDAVTLGFDGSHGRTRGNADATALIGCRVRDGHLFELAVWEAPAGPQNHEWQAPAVEIDLAVRQAFRTYNVVGFYADPAKWESYVAEWEAAFGKELKVKAAPAHPIEWWMTGQPTKTVRALEQFHTATVNGELSHDGSSILARHVLNARRRNSRAGLQIAKEHPDSDRKIDAAVAAVLAFEARMAALALPAVEDTFVPRRIR
jgi:hypothetical protein